MADYAHSHSHQRNRTHDSSSTTSNGNAFMSKNAYEDVFGGSSKFGIPSFSSRVDDYTEIFSSYNGNGNLSRGSSIPFLDLPVVDESDFSVEIPSSEIDYLEIFGGFADVDYAIPYEELFVEQPKAEETSSESEEVWTPAETGSPSEASSEDPACLESNQAFPNIESQYAYDGVKQFNVSYHKTNQLSKEDGFSGRTHIAQLNAVPAYTLVVDENLPLQKTTGDNPLPGVANDPSLDTGSTDWKMDGDHFWEAMPLPLPSRNDQKPQKNLDGNDIHNGKPFVTVSEINLRTEPLEVPPPSRPPPKLTIKQGSQNSVASDFKTSATYAGHGAASGSSPPFFDVEVDISSPAAASAAAMKEAMEKAQARLKSAKEMMERKKDGLQHRKKTGMKEESIAKERKLTEESHKKEAIGEWKAEEQYYELVKKDTVGTVLVIPESKKSERNLKSATRVYEHEQNQKKAEKVAFVLQEKSDDSFKAAKRVSELEEDKKRSNVAEAACEREDHEKKLKAAQKVYDQEEHEKRQNEARKLREAKKKLTEEREREEYENQLKEAREQKKKESLEQEEYERKLKEAHERKEQEKKLKELHEREENEKKKKEALQREENERRQKEAREKEEFEKRTNEKIQKEARQREEYERRQKEAREMEENKKKQEAARQREENERRQKEAHEIEENKKKQEARVREENERRQKEARQKEENEKIINEKNQMEARQREENERRQKEAREREENEKRLKESYERQENERKLKQAVEENERRLIEAREREDDERRKQEEYERKENEKRLREAHEREENERIFKQAAEENERRLKDDHEQEEIVKIQKESHDHEENEKRRKEPSEEVSERQLQKETLDKVENEKNLRKLPGGSEFKKILEESCKWGEQGEKLRKAADQEETKKRQNKAFGREENDQHQFSQDFHTFNDGEKNLKEEIESETMAECEKTLEEHNNTCKQDGKNSKGTCGGTEQEENNKKLKLAEESCRNEEYEKTMKTVQLPREHDESEESKDNQRAALKAQEAGSEKKSGSIEDAVRPDKDEKCMEEDLVALNCRDITRSVKASQGTAHWVGDGMKIEIQLINEEEKRTKPKLSDEFTTIQEKKDNNLNGTVAREVNGKDGWTVKEREQEKERLGKLEADRKREREREKDRVAVERVTREARERAYAEARDRAERAAVERATAEARQRAMADARERLEKACAEAREKSLAEKAYTEARIRAERAAVERATAEARERAEKAMTERAAMEARERVERSVSEKFSVNYRDSRLRPSSSFSDLRDAKFQSAGTFSSSQRYSNSGASTTEKSQGAEVESAQRCKARLERNQRTVERAAKALAEKNSRDHVAQREQTERNRLSETLDADVKRWSSGKEGNLRALLSTLQYILGPESGWQPVPLTDVITAVAVKKAYRKATLCVHPDKLQQRGASIQQKYICEKVFDLLKDAWNKFNSEER